MKKLLITAFEPFGGEKINASMEALRLLPDQIGDWVLTKKIIPVVFREAAALTIAAAEEFGADAVLCIGQAAGRTKVMPEMVAINLMHAGIPDNKGNRPQDEPIVPGSDNAYFSTLPVRLMAAAILDAGLPGGVSYSAGAYVCNDIFYELCHHFRHTPVMVGFVHVPAIPTDTRAGLLPEQTSAALEAAIGAITVS